MTDARVLPPESGLAAMRIGVEFGQLLFELEPVIGRPLDAL